MPNNEIDKYNETTFDSIKHIDELDNEYWEARELQKVLEYSNWQNFKIVIDKAVVSLETEGSVKEDWLIEVNKPIITGKGKEELILDYRLSRYICYLIVQNGDPRKKVIAEGQKYFAVQTRKQELNEKDYNALSEEEKRFYNRNITKKGNYLLNEAARNAGVKNFDKFHNFGYKGLYNGETADDIAKRKGLRYREDILDNMGSDELAANIFRISQTKQKIENDNIQTEKEANKAHYKVGAIVRNAIKRSGGTMPEKLSTPTKSLKELEKKEKRELVVSKKGSNDND
jgi:DNA-damage-inducible protein D